MTTSTPLSGQRILVLEDDYYLATDTADAVRRAGATVVGPYSCEQDALAQIKLAAPTIALLDINLGLGPSFNIARMLKQRGVPLIFVTGYNEEMIRGEFERTPRLRTPVNMWQVLTLVTKELGLPHPELR